MPDSKNKPITTDPVAQATATQIANIEKSTGKKIDAWIAIVNQSGLDKHGELVNFLKEQHGFTHGNANLVVHYAKQSFAGAESNDTDWITEQYKGKENLRPWYDKIMATITEFGPDIEVAPKKAYVSLRRKKQFAILQPSTKDRLDLGLNIKGVPPSGFALAAGSWNAMCTHRIKLEDEKMLDKELFQWVRQAYDQAG
jgi:predicted transport protein